MRDAVFGLVCSTKHSQKQFHYLINLCSFTYMGLCDERFDVIAKY